MSLIVETGSGSPSSDSYVSVAEASVYLAKLGNVAWDALDSEVQEQCLRKATQYLVGTYRYRWSGSRKTFEQSLDWPRSLVPLLDVPYLTYFSDSSVPVEVKNACSLLALRAVQAPLLADQGQSKASVTVGPISTTYETGSSPRIKYSEVDSMLRPFLKSGNGQMKMVRR